MIKHGELKRGRHSSEANTYIQMIQRCTNPNDKAFKNYGGRGITVCDRWKGEFGLVNFINDMGRRPEGLSLDRIDNDGPYSPENCRWATRKEQQRNRRANVYVTIDGRTACVTEWSEILGISIKTVRKRMNKFGWSAERALTEPVETGRRPTHSITVQGVTLSVRQWSEKYGIPDEVIRQRLASGWSAEQAVSKPVRPKKGRKHEH